MAMSEAPPRVRAVARVGADASTERGPAIFVPRRRPGYLGPVNVMQLVLLEALVVLVLVLMRNSRWLLLVGAVLTIVVLILTFGRSRGRWWLESAVIRSQYRRRQHSGYLPADDLRLVALHRLVPDLTVQTVQGFGGTQVGVGRDGAGSFAVVAITPPAGMRGDALAPLPLGALATIVHESEQPGAVLQVVTHTVPAPGIAIDPRRPAADSYRQLLGGFGGSLPSDQVVWIAVRFDATSVAEAQVGGEDESGELPTVLAALVRRVGKALRRAKLEYQVLDADGLLDALARSCDLEQPQSGGPPARAQEGWAGWRSTSLEHACFWLSEWPDLAHSGELMDQLSRTTAALTSVAVLLTPRGNVTEVRCLTRVAAEPEMLPRTCEQARKAAERAGGRLLRLDGEQAPAVYASAPSGGGSR
jgi:type VII secretion protein EccE